ncbi:acyl-phosphate--glycerol-3-phosphate O-acyltransferase [Campylobacter sp. MIT 99-7217]|uniref:glycerol-3-phosphate 1-O-acyltransferase PlsY n=1 Tax=Campylobacter sp. MIT 99-7217 TaxID=535091 RepID=UPI00115A8527|nr:glycerol-3-phosphate 1-O-acyltransferase PlsY [Campylobacter sp. MIT 99-7217]TQR33168.1 acyl-phosphate--glycerol-3-phosphate O-acyltransferase [Campylobacter sp. MIT 99-7217]
MNLMIYLLAYLIGSIPFGLLLAQFFAKINIQNEGSKSIGATNVLRVVKKENPKLAKKLAVATLLLDFAKAFVPIILAQFLGFDDNMLWSIGVFCVLGHCFSAYLSLEGGKGVATAAGVMAALLPLELLIGFVAWFIVAKVFKISSLASLVALVFFLASSFILHYDMSINTHAPVLIICFIIVYKHIPNIKRMFKKEECKVI